MCICIGPPRFAFATFAPSTHLISCLLRIGCALLACCSFVSLLSPFLSFPSPSSDLAPACSKQPKTKMGPSGFVFCRPAPPTSTDETLIFARRLNLG